jgi:hypothetical protein
LNLVETILLVIKYDAVKLGLKDVAFYANGAWLGTEQRTEEEVMRHRLRAGMRLGVEVGSLPWATWWRI